MSVKSERKELVAAYCWSNPPEGYDETAKRVNKSYAETEDIHQTMPETRLPFDVVWDMVGFRDEDEMDWMDTQTVDRQPNLQSRLSRHYGSHRNDRGCL